MYGTGSEGSRQCREQAVQGTDSAGNRQCREQTVQGTESAENRNPTITTQPAWGVRLAQNWSLLMSGRYCLTQGLLEKMTRTTPESGALF